MAHPWCNDQGYDSRSPCHKEHFCPWHLRQKFCSTIWFAVALFSTPWRSRIPALQLVIPQFCSKVFSNAKCQAEILAKMTIIIGHSKLNPVNDFTNCLLTFPNTEVLIQMLGTRRISEEVMEIKASRTCYVCASNMIAGPWSSEANGNCHGGRFLPVSWEYSRFCIYHW